MLALSKSLPAKTAPGEAWEYNNGGYAVLGAIVEKLTGKPWYDAVQERISRPLGLSSIRYAVGADTAARYVPSGSGGQPVEGIDMSIAGAAGALVGNVGDMAKWANALHSGKVVRPDLYAEMIRPATLNSGKTFPYGFGLHLRRLLDKPMIEHGGSGRGIDTASAYLPDDKLFVAVFANANGLPTDSSDVMRRIAAAALGSPFPAFTEVPVDAGTIAPLLGRYGSGGQEVRFLRRKDDYFVAVGDDEVRVLAAGNDRFFSASSSLNWVQFIRGADGALSIQMNNASSARPRLHPRIGDLPAVAPVKAPAAVLRTYVGRYRTETLPVTVSVAADGDLIMQAEGQAPMPLRAVSETEFRTEDNRMRIVFHPEDGKTDRFTIHRGARELHGVRVSAD
ncbi:serine hydrolase domain-containing protein [Sphingomonas piscis]|uniref:serine hydrolase domain-containing protein n=1 Tax=Sphingomonas piscis TaxID=2714943 RepID=UPI0031B650CA